MSTANGRERDQDSIALFPPYSSKRTARGVEHAVGRQACLPVILSPFASLRVHSAKNLTYLGTRSFVALRMTPQGRFVTSRMRKREGYLTIKAQDDTPRPFRYFTPVVLIMHGVGINGQRKRPRHRSIWLGKGTRTALAPTRRANDAAASTAKQSGTSKGEAPPPFIHAAHVPTYGVCLRFSKGGFLMQALDIDCYTGYHQIHAICIQGEPLIYVAKGIAVDASERVSGYDAKTNFI